MLQAGGHLGVVPSGGVVLLQVLHQDFDAFPLIEQAFVHRQTVQRGAVAIPLLPQIGQRLLLAALAFPQVRQLLRAVRRDRVEVGEQTERFPRPTQGNPVLPGLAEALLVAVAGLQYGSRSFDAFH